MECTAHNHFRFALAIQLVTLLKTHVPGWSTQRCSLRSVESLNVSLLGNGSCNSTGHLQKRTFAGRRVGAGARAGAELEQELELEQVLEPELELALSL